MQVKSTYILANNLVMYETFSGKFFVTYHIVGQVKEITLEEAMKLKLTT